VNISVRIKRLRPGAIVPTYARPGDAGLDLHACIEQRIRLFGLNASCAEAVPKLIGTGIAIELPEGYEAQVRGRSGLSKNGLLVFPGTIDAGYRGEIKVCIQNLTQGTVTVHPGDRIAQLVIAPVARAELVEVDALSESERGEGGFGSTGR